MLIERGQADGVAQVWAGRNLAAVVDVAILLLLTAALGLTIAAAAPPRFLASLSAHEMVDEGGDAFTFTPDFSTHWPYAIPSRPVSTLRSDDVKVFENGRFIGALTPSHDAIRQSGSGKYNVWNGVLWFSSSDNTDPRTNGRIYGIRVKARLAASAEAALIASSACLAILVFCRAGPAIATFFARTKRRWSSTVLAKARMTAPSRAPIAGLLARVPLTTGRIYVATCSAMMALFCWGTIARPMPLMFGDDSFTFVNPGILWSAGQNVAELSSRGVGYALLTLLALAFGSLRLIPKLQLVAVMAGVSCILAVLYLLLAALAMRLHRSSQVPQWILASCASVVAATYCVMLASHDAFVIDIYRALAEALHLLPTAVVLVSFVLAWMTRAPAWRLSSLIVSASAAYLSTVVKPHTSMVLALCGLSLAIVIVRNYRALRSPAVLSLCCLSAILIVSIHRLDTWITPKGFDFGPKTLFCNHLDVAEPVFDASTPERSLVRGLLKGVLQHPHPDWPLLGFQGDACMYGADFNRAMQAAARAEGLEPAAWERREFLKAVMKNPIGYGRAVWKQFAFFMAYPIKDADSTATGIITDDEWRSLKLHADLIDMSREQFTIDLSNWVATTLPRVAAVGKTILWTVSISFAFTTVSATSIALGVFFLQRKRAAVQAEIALLSVAAFTLAFALTTMLAHTFDVSRYLTDILPFSLLWWLMSVVYIVHGFILIGTRAGPARISMDRRAAPCPAA